MWPGLQLQKLTTRDPDREQLEVAIAGRTASANATRMRIRPCMAYASPTWVLARQVGHAQRRTAARRLSGRGGRASRRNACVNGIGRDCTETLANFHT